MLPIYLNGQYGVYFPRNTGREAFSNVSDRDYCARIWNRIIISQFKIRYGISWSLYFTVHLLTG